MMDADTSLNYKIYNLLDALWRRRFFFAISLIGVPIMSCVAFFFAPKHYEASTSIATYSSAPPIMKDVSFLPDIEEQFSGLNAYMNSPTVLRKIATHIGLINSNTGQEAEQKIISGLSKEITITLVEKNVVEIKLVKDDPKDMVVILKMLSDVFINQYLSPLTASTRSSVNYLKSELASQKKKLDELRDALSLFEENNTSYLPAYGSIYFARLRQIITDLGSKNAEYKGALSEENELRQSLLKVNPILGSLDNAISENDVKIDKMRLIYTDNYSGLKSALEIGKSLRFERGELYKKLQNLTEDNLQQLWNMALASSMSNNGKESTQLLASQLEDFQKLKIKQKGLAESIASLNAQQAEMTEKLNKVSMVQKQLSPLKQAVTDNMTLYQDLLKRYNMTNLTAYLNNFDKLTNVKIVASPQMPFKSSGKPFLFFLVVGIFGGLILGFGQAIFLELIDNSVRKKQTIEALTGVPVICRVGRMSLG